jgi:uncharacterized protein
MFTPPPFQFNGHLQTILPSLFRKIIVPLVRERMTLPDGDFLLLDWLRKGNKKCVIVTHGLEGDSRRHYVTGILKKFSDNGFDGLGWNCRSCGGEINRLPRFYHHGDASDLKYVIEQVASNKMYEEIYLVGFSMGGSLTLRTLAENAPSHWPSVKKAMVASVPLDLISSVAELDKKGKRFYMRRFLQKLKKKIIEKEKMFPGHPILHVQNYEQIKNFEHFDNRYTAPLHGYVDAVDFYTKASVKPLLSKIMTPTLIVQAQNDPFLTPQCIDLGIASQNPFVKLVLTPHGGHVGFEQKGTPETYFEQRAFAFASDL